MIADLAPAGHVLASSWWDPATWWRHLSGLFSGAFNLSTGVENALGGVLTILGGIFRLFTDTGHFVQDAVEWLADAWGILNLPPGAATVRDAVAALTVNRQPPRPVHATTPALACYPEARDASEYTHTEIERLAAYLKGQYTLTVVDMSNRLPDPTGGPEAAAAAYWLEVADAVVLPTASSKQDFNGVLDYLDVPGLPPAVVAYIVPRTRRSREHPLTRRYLAAIAQRVSRVVEVPDEAEPVRYAVMEGIPIDAVSPRLRSAYRRLTEAVVSVHQQARR